MIDLSSETLLTLAQAARLRPPGRRGRPTHVSTIYRWIARGVRGHKLQAIRLGGALFTSREALQRFAEQLTLGPDGPPRPPTGADKRRVAAAADEELTRLRF
jgi:hypothetical protein